MLSAPEPAAHIHKLPTNLHALAFQQNNSPASAAASSRPRELSGSMCSAEGGGACIMPQRPGGGTPITE